MALANTTLGITPTTIYTSSGQSAVTLIYFCNRSLAPITFTVHAVTNGETATLSNIIYYDVPLAPTDTFVLDTERLILDAGDSIVALASQVDSMSVTVSYVGV